MITVTLYTKPDCSPCDQAYSDLTAIQENVPHNLVVVNLEKNPALMQIYGTQAPVVEAGPYRMHAPFSRQDLIATLGAARDRMKALEAVEDPHYAERIKRGHEMNSADRISAWLSNHYMLLFNLIIFIYVGLPFLAPVLMKVGAQGPAKIIYKMYSPLCHQLAYRSWFLFGEQTAYPRALAGVRGLITYEAATGLNPLDLNAGRDFLGNPAMGYKVAVCERDVAIYGAFLAFGILFAATKHRIRSLPWYLVIVLGVLPIAIDGFSQLPSLMQIPFISWLPVRESTPALRALTGALFGFSIAWFGYPYVEESMAETRRIFEHKVAVVTNEKIR